MRRGLAIVLGVLALQQPASAAPTVKPLGIDLPSRPGWSRDGSWFGVVETDQVERFDRNGQALPSWPIKTKIKAIVNGVPAVSPDGKHVSFVADVRGTGDGPIAPWVLDVTTGKLTAMFDPAQKPGHPPLVRTPFWMAYGRALFIAGEGVWGYAPWGAELTPMCKSLSFVRDLAQSADDQHLAVLTVASGIVVTGKDCDSPGHGISRVGLAVSGFVLAPAAEHIAVWYTHAKHETVWVTRLDASQPVQVMPEAEVSRPAWLDDDVLVFNAEARRGGKHGPARAIYTYTVSTGATTMVAGTAVKSGYANEVVSAPRQGGVVLLHGANGKLALLVPGADPVRVTAVTPPPAVPAPVPDPVAGVGGLGEQPGTPKGYWYRIWRTGNQLYMVGDQGARHSSDGGRTWQGTDSGALLFDLWGSGPDDVYLVGRGIIHHSKDGGASWQQLAPGDLAGANFFGMWGVARGELYVAGGDVVLHTTDGGVTWQRTRPVAGATLRSLWGTGADNMYLATEAGEILRSTDHGKSWVMQRKAIAGHDLVRIWGSGPKDIYAVGFGPTLTHSSDGVTWREQSTPAGAGGSSLTEIWGTAADDVYTLTSSTLHHSSDGGASWQEVPGIPSGMYVLSVGGTRHDLWVLGLDRVLRGAR